MESNNKDAVLNDIDLIPEDTSYEAVIDLIHKALEELACIRSDVMGLKFLISSPQLVGKNAGRKRCKMYYMDKEITDKELKDLKKQISTAEILKDFKYVNEYGRVINPALSNDNKKKCKSMINNRTRY